MSLAGDILKRAGIATEPAPTKSPRLPVSKKQKFGGTVSTPNGPVRIAAHGQPDRRSLQRGKPKPHKRREPTSPELLILRREFEACRPGDMMAWDWRTPETYSDLKLRNAQCMYAYKVAEIYGFKVSLLSRPQYLQITMVGERSP